MKKALKILFALAALTAACASPARAIVIVNATEVGGNVVFAGGGRFNLIDLTLVNSSAMSRAWITPSAVTALFGTNPGTALPVDLYGSISSPGPFGPGGVTFADLGLGDRFGFSGTLLIVPHGYISGNLLNASNTFTGATFASLGLTPGSYTWTWGDGLNADTFTLNIVATPAAVPESGSSAVSLLLGLSAVALVGRSGSWLRGS